MSLGLPSHLASVTVSRSHARTLHVAAFVALLCAAVVVVAFAADNQELILWPALAAIAFIGVALWLVDRYPSVLTSVSYLVVGAASVYWYTLAVYSQLTVIAESAAIWLALPKIALVMVASPLVGSLSASVWCVLGYVSAEVVASVAVISLGGDLFQDAYTLLAMAIVLATILLTELARVRARRAQPQLHRAARDERLADLRARLELKAAALLHDTVLSHLNAIASSPTVAVSDELRSQIERDLEIIVGQEWLNDGVSGEPAQAAENWKQTPFYTAVDAARSQGLEVEVTGDISAAARLNDERATALGLAVTQCLSNVIMHSGQSRAEVAIYGTDTDVSIMVIDHGVGFVVNAIAADRLGLRASVSKRMEAVGGAVQVWSTPGMGTSVLIQAPVAAQAQVPSAVTAGDAV